MRNKKRRISGGLLALFMLFILLMLPVGCGKETQKSTSRVESVSFEDIPYSMQTEPLEERFPDAGNIVRAYWKSNLTGEDGRAVGPSTYRIAGFMIMDSLPIAGGEDYKDISYPEFPEGIDPFITGLSGFDWREYPSVGEKLRGSRFIGDIYIDREKKLIYFNLENL